jgi:hypothetical protein
VVVNTVRYLIDDTEAQALVASGMFAVTSDRDRRFPPAVSVNPTIDDSGSFQELNALADHVGSYVAENFATVTGCATATDACATAYLGNLATRAYRRPLTADEQSRFTALYAKLRASQIVNGYEVTFTVEEATNYAVEALLSSPQMLWRWELGDPAMASTAPAGIPLTDAELATHLAFFLTDQPPDAVLLAAANAGTLRANLSAQVDRLLATSAARDWLRTIVEVQFRINQLPNARFSVDPAQFPVFTPTLVADMDTEARLFLDNALWNGNLTDLLTSRTTFLNANLASNIYAVPVPAGATATNFVQTTLPSEQRSGLLTNAAVLTSLARLDGHGLVVPRGRFVTMAMLCIPPPPPPDTIPPDIGPTPIGAQTSQQQVATRAAVPLCNSCHSVFDPYGLALDYYDNIGRYRTIDDLGQPVDGHTTLPAAAGGGMVDNAIDLARALAASPAFTNCMAGTILQYAMVDFSAPVEVPLPPQQAGCAAADVVQRYQGASGKTFTDLVRATAAAPAFVLRRVAP